MDLSLLDTDILTEIFKLRNHTVAANAIAYLQQHGQFAISAITRFEVIRDCVTSELRIHFSVSKQCAPACSCYR
jgi:hypothetical protein